MITENRLTAYINSLDQGDEELIEQIAETAVKNRVPIIRREAVGYSALLMASVMPENCRITTIEKYEKRIPEAKENFRLAGMEEKITLLEGDAGEILAGLSGSFDFIFMDAAKGQYINWLPDILRLLRDGGLLMSDNVLQDGTIMESRYAVERRDRTIHERMREYLYTLKHMDEFETSILPVGDGVALSVKNRSGKD